VSGPPRKRSPAFQFYPGEWLSSTKVAMMNLAEQGAYLRLLCHEWADPHCTLPDDDEQLAVLSGLGEGWFNGGSVKIRACFQKHPKRPLRIFNVRLRLERRKQEAWRRKSREGGVRSGESRRNKPKGGSSLVESVANQKATLQSSSSDLRNTPPLPSGEETPRASQTGSVEGLAPEELVRAWNENCGGMAGSDHRHSSSIRANGCPRRRWR
jgi:uncharacterized protein YdaU (DUF1376 family)